MKRMLILLRDALRKKGLELHPSKCKAQTNCSGRVARGNVRIDDGFSIQVLAEGAPLEVLGTTLALADVTGCEILHRIACAWRKFWSLKKLLLNPGVSMRCRLKLFDATVGSCALWCCRSWTPRFEELRHLRVAWHSMLRRICGQKRAPDEDYVGWIQRCTARARLFAARACVREWVHTFALYKWAWAGHAARRPADTWLWKVTCWRDTEWNQSLANVSGRPLRPSRQRWMKWEHVLHRFARQTGLGSWTCAAQSKQQWLTHQVAFASFVCSSMVSNREDG